MPNGVDAIRASYRIVQATSVHARAMASDAGPDPPLAALGEVGQPRAVESAAAGARADADARGSADELARRRAARELWARDMTALASRVGPPDPDDGPPTFTYRIGPDGRPYAVGDARAHEVRDRDGEPEIRGPTHADAKVDDTIGLDARPTRGDPEARDVDATTEDVDEPPRAELVRQAYASATERETSAAVDVMA